jgi:TolB protein
MSRATAKKGTDLFLEKGTDLFFGRKINLSSFPKINLSPFLLLLLLLLLLPLSSHAAREAVLKQVQAPHSYYWRELYLPQLTTGPSSADFTADGSAVVYSMGGSLWLQQLGSSSAEELSRGPGYDYHPDVSPDGKHVVFARRHGDAIELVEMELSSRRERVLTADAAVAVEPRYSPDGKRLVYVSTRAAGRFALWLAERGEHGLLQPERVFEEHSSPVTRYYYAAQDHEINPSWSPDGSELYFVSNRGQAWGSGDIWSVALDKPAEWRRVLVEETTWSARPELAPDGRRLLYSSYQGRQWHQLWLTTPAGEAPLPLTFGEFDRRHARWSPDGERVLYISNEGGNTSLWVQDVVGGERREIVASERRWRNPMVPLRIELRDGNGAAIAGRISVLGADGRHYAPEQAWMRADDGFDRAQQDHETHYFHCDGDCTLQVPPGVVSLGASAGFERQSVERSLRVPGTGMQLQLALPSQALPQRFGSWISLDQHVHMNYGGHYRNDVASLARSARAEDLDVLYNLIVNKEQRVNDIAEFRREAQLVEGVTVYQAQEFHTSYWGHLGLLHLGSHVLTADFSAYRHTALASPWPHNGVVAALARRQGALVGYVHPYDWPIRPEEEKTLTHTLPADVALGNVDYLEVVSFADHLATAEVWHRLLNLGYRLPAGAGTDAMANYASLRGPVGLNRLFLNQSDTSAQALIDGIRHGRGFVSNGPLLGFELDGRRSGDVIALAAPGELNFDAALRGNVPVERLEILVNGTVVRSLAGKSLRAGDFSGSIRLDRSGWVVLRAYGKSQPGLMDIYPYASTNPLWIEMAGRPLQATEDAAYFIAWLDRVIVDASARDDYNSAREKTATLQYLQDARRKFEEKL